MFQIIIGAILAFGVVGGLAGATTWMTLKDEEK
jgi:hypothetical protein